MIFIPAPFPTAVVMIMALCDFAERMRRLVGRVVRNEVCRRFEGGHTNGEEMKAMVGQWVREYKAVRRYLGGEINFLYTIYGMDLI